LVNQNKKTEEKIDLNDFGFNAYIIHKPGHTSGSMSVVVDNEQHLKPPLLINQLSVWHTKVRQIWL